MNLINTKINNFFIVLLQLAYAYLGYKINLQYKYNSGTEYLVGIIVTIILMNVIEQICFLIAYNLTGMFSNGGLIDRSERKGMHWVIRIILYIIVYIIAITPLCSILITPLVKNCTKYAVKWINGSGKDVSNAFENSVI